MKNILRKSNFGFTKWCVGMALLRSEPRKFNRSFGGLRASLLLALTAGWMGMGNNSFATLNYFEDFTTAGVLTANGWTAFSSRYKRTYGELTWAQLRGTCEFWKRSRNDYW